jgi:hypothetical protein
MIEDCVSPYRQPQPLFAMAKRLKIDPAKIKKEIADEERAAKKAAGAGDAKPAKAAKKKATKK